MLLIYFEVLIEEGCCFKISDSLDEGFIKLFVINSENNNLKI